MYLDTKMCLDTSIVATTLWNGGSLQQCTQTCAFKIYCINIFLRLQLKYRINSCPYYYLIEHVGDYVSMYDDITSFITLLWTGFLVMNILAIRSLFCTLQGNTTKIFVLHRVLSNQVYVVWLLAANSIIVSKLKWQWLFRCVVSFCLPMKCGVSRFAE
jgi:hypothetical protein